MIKQVDDPEYRYGQWAGNPKGHAQNPNRCVEEVVSPGSRSMLFQQCSRKRGYGKNGLFCSQHALRHPANAQEDA